VQPPSGLAEEILAGLAAQEAQGSAPQAAAAASEAPPVDRIGFFALPAADEQSAPPQPSEHLATFLLDREEYGVDVRSVQEIIRVPAITPVPRAPERVRGVVNLRGRVIPVFDLKRALGVGEVQLARASRIVVVRLRDRLLGLLVDGAAQVLRVPVSSIVQPPEEAGPPEVAGVRGMARLPSRLIILLDLERVFEAELARETRPRDGRRA
jgi:purine-binding chemotaxis protein CheW